MWGFTVDSSYTRSDYWGAVRTIVGHKSPVSPLAMALGSTGGTLHIVYGILFHWTRDRGECHNCPASLGCSSAMGRLLHVQTFLPM